MTTLFVAVGGLIGVMSRYGLTRLTIHHETLLWITGVGVLGGFTTFSTFSVQASSTSMRLSRGAPRSTSQCPSWEAWRPRPRATCSAATSPS
jgi:fluoride ion exporter CrcB/FEX